jgi:uncharacterized membrane protein
MNARTSSPSSSSGADASLRRAKRPRSIIAGPYGHPFHPIMVTIPIGSWTASLIFDIIGFFAEDPTGYVIAAQILVAIGIIGAVLAAVLGLLDFTTLAKGTPARRTALIHMILNLSAVVLFAISWVVRAGSDHDEVSVVGFVLSLIAFLIVGASGWLGGKLSYHYGVRVADETTQAEGFR